MMMNECKNRKKHLIIGVSIILGILIIVLLWNFMAFISDKNEYIEEARSTIDNIEQNISNGNYSDAISSLEYYKEEYGNNDHKYNKYLSEDMNADSVYDKHMSEIENSLYEKISNEQNLESKESYCNEYLSTFPNGQYIESVNEILVDLSDELVSDRFEEVNELISEGEYEEADTILAKIINSNNISEIYKNEAQQIRDSIAYKIPQYVSLMDLLTYATDYNMREVKLVEDIIAVNVDRERQMILTYPVSEDSTYGFDTSKAFYIDYRNLSDKTKWSNVSPDNTIKITMVTGTFKIYSNRNNMGYIEADNIVSSIY